jgi:hypothetical protein
VIRTEKAKVSCKECGFEWFGATAAHALRMVGSCTKCRGELEFMEESTAPADAARATDVPAHLVLGTPRF